MAENFHQLMPVAKVKQVPWPWGPVGVLNGSASSKVIGFGGSISVLTTFGRRTVDEHAVGVLNMQICRGQTPLNPRAEHKPPENVWFSQSNCDDTVSNYNDNDV